LCELLNTNLNGRISATLDWSSFDANIPNFVIKTAFHIVESLIDFDYITTPTGFSWVVKE